MPACVCERACVRMTACVRVRVRVRACVSARACVCVSACVRACVRARSFLYESARADVVALRTQCDALERELAETQRRLRIIERRSPWRAARMCLACVRACADSSENARMQKASQRSAAHRSAAGCGHSALARALRAVGRGPRAGGGDQSDRRAPRVVRAGAQALPSRCGAVRCGAPLGR